MKSYYHNLLDALFNTFLLIVISVLDICLFFKSQQASPTRNARNTPASTEPSSYSTQVELSTQDVPHEIHTSYSGCQPLPRESGGTDTQDSCREKIIRFCL